MTQALQIPSFLANRQSRSLVDSATAGLSTARPPHISRKGNRFTMVDGAGNQKPVALMDPNGNVYIDVVVIDVNPAKSKTYYAGKWSEDSTEGPACFSDNGTGPSVHASKPQAPTCAVCPMAEWGSATSKLTGAAIPACQDGKKLAVIIPGDPANLVYEFVVPPASFSDKETGWVRYGQSLRTFSIGSRSADLCDVVTRISFVPGKMGIMAFTAVSLIDEAMAARMDAAWAADSTAAVVGKTDKARDPSLPVAAKPVAQHAPAGQLPPPPQAQPMPLATQIAAASVGIQPQQLQPMAELPKRTRGRPAKNPEPAAAPQVAPFLQQPAASPPVLPPQQTAGIVNNPPPVPNDLMASIDAAFNLKLPKIDDDIPF